MSHKYPPVVIVDEEDNEIGLAMLAEVWEKGLYHRIVSIFVKDDAGRMLLQLRGPEVKIHPNMWDQAAAGHVDEGFNYETAAKSELAEELGLRGVPLKVLGTFRSNNVLDDGRTINQFERVYLAQIPHDTALQLEAAEVADVKWFTSTELTKEITQHPEKFTPGLLYGLHTYLPEY